MENITVTFSADDSWRAIIEEELEDAAQITYRKDVDEADRPDLIADSRAILSWNLNRELSADEMEALSSADFMQLLSAGADHLPFERLPRELTIASNVGGYAEPIAEYVLGTSIALARRLREEHENLREGAFNQRVPVRTLRGATVGIVGFGGIGRATADLFRALNADIWAINRSGETSEPVAWCGTLDELPELLEASDVVVLALPATRKTEAIFDAATLDRMKDDAILINVARAELIEQEALYEHLQAHPEFKAGLDTWWVEPWTSDSFDLEYPLLDLPNVIGSPHNSAVVAGSLETALGRAARNLAAFIRGEEYDGEVDRDEYV